MTLAAPGSRLKYDSGFSSAPTDHPGQHPKMGKKKDSKGESSEALGAPSANGTTDEADAAGPPAADLKAAAGKAAETTKQVVSGAAAQATKAASAVAREATQVMLFLRNPCLYTARRQRHGTVSKGFVRLVV